MMLLTVCCFSRRPSAPTQTAAIEELDSSDCSSDGTVDELIERSSYTVTEAASSSYGFDASLFTVAARLLKSPGVQREIVSAALSDPEVFDILAGKMDLVSRRLRHKLHIVLGRLARVEARGPAVGGGGKGCQQAADMCCCLRAQRGGLNHLSAVAAARDRNSKGERHKTPALTNARCFRPPLLLPLPLLLPAASQPAYLGSQGLAARGLLPSTDTAAVQEEGGASLDAADEDSSSVLDDLSAWAADRVEGLGFAVVRLGRWMRGKLSGAQQDANSDSTASSSSRGAGQAAGGGDSAFMRRVGGGTLAAVMVAMVAIVTVVLLKKPVMLRRMPKRFV